MKPDKKWIISIAAAVVALGAAVTAVIVFRDQLRELLAHCPKPGRHPKEFDDYADVE